MNEEFYESILEELQNCTNPAEEMPRNELFMLFDKYYSDEYMNLPGNEADKLPTERKFVEGTPDVVKSAYEEVQKALEEEEKAGLIVE